MLAQSFADLLDPRARLPRGLRHVIGLAAHAVVHLLEALQRLDGGVLEGLRLARERGGELLGLGARLLAEARELAGEGAERVGQHLALRRRLAARDRHGLCAALQCLEAAARAGGEVDRGLVEPLGGAGELLLDLAAALDHAIGRLARDVAHHAVEILERALQALHGGGKTVGRPLARRAELVERAVRGALEPCYRVAPGRFDLLGGFLRAGGEGAAHRQLHHGDLAREPLGRGGEIAPHHLLDALGMGLQRVGEPRHRVGGRHELTLRAFGPLGRRGHGGDDRLQAPRERGGRVLEALDGLRRGGAQRLREDP